MKIIVCMKWVPETSAARIDEDTGTVVRQGVENIINPLDLHALEAALQIKDEIGADITALSMGPNSAEKGLREALSMGADSAILLSDRAFAGSDTWATARVLSRAIERLGRADIVITGERATDGETGQVGPGIAAFLDYPLATFVSRIESIADGKATVEASSDAGYQTLRLPMPCVLTVTREITRPRLPTLSGKQRARMAEISVLGAEALGLEAGDVGQKGSPTRVVKIDKPPVGRSGETVDARKVGAEEAARRLADYLDDKQLLWKV